MEAVILAYSAEQEQRFGQAGRRLEMIAGPTRPFSIKSGVGDDGFSVGLPGAGRDGRQ